MSFLLLLLSCETVSDVYTPACILDRPTLSLTEASPGTSVTVSLSPLTTQWDTAVTVGSTRAEITEFTRDGCSECDICVSSNGCAACGSCESCNDLCASCTETLSFQVPVMEAGTWPVTVINHHGRSTSASLSVVAPADTGADSAP